MCGICGIYRLSGNEPVSEAVIDRLNNALVHRGPDDGRVHVDGAIALGHRRLSIIDLESGQQPMCNEDGSIWVTYNGEVYNHASLRAELIQRGHAFRTHCDTEVLVHAYEEYGDDCVSHLNGMFAFAVWDGTKEELFLARDRLGIKPLYYTTANGLFIFASEIKAILQHPRVEARIELGSVPEYLLCTVMLNGNTMFSGISSLPAGHTLLVKKQGMRASEYWDIRLADTTPPTSRDENADRIRELLAESVKMRLMSDVPFGSLLSGGLDSSAISALATRHVTERLMTFSMDYAGSVELKNIDSDTPYARLMANAFDTDHREFIFQPEEYREVIERATWHLEKPLEFTTPSVYLLHKNVKKSVTVVLSGEGADELFAGYFFFLEEARRGRVTEFPWAPYYKEVSSLLRPAIAKKTGFDERLRLSLSQSLNRYGEADFLNRTLYLFMKFYLLEMLERQDKMSMAWSVEARVPFLDHRLVEYVANLPSSSKIVGDTEKYLLKEACRSFLPAEIVDRKKKPFPFPVDPRSMHQQRKRANELVQSKTSSVSEYFDAKRTDDFFNRRNEFRGIDGLAIFRTSHAIISLELWHNAFRVSSDGC